MTDGIRGRKDGDHAAAETDGGSIHVHGPLEDKAALLASLVECSNDAIVVKTLEGTILSWNAGAASIYGYETEEVIGRPISILVPPGHANEEPGIVERIVQGETIHHYETERRRKDGRIINVSMGISPVRDKDGGIVGVATIARDITEEVTARQQAESSLSAERRRFVDVLDNLPAFLILLTPDYHVSFANRYFREHFGEPDGRRCYELLFGRTEPCETCESYGVLKTNRPHEWVWKGPNERTYDILDVPFTDTDGSVLVMETGIDVTERKQAEDALRGVSAYNRSLIEASPDPLVTIGPDGKITDVNEATVRVTGIPREELIGTDFSNYFTEPAKAREGYLQVFAKGFVTDYPLTIRRRDGLLTAVLYNASVYKDAQGNVQGMFAAARDVTARRKAEEELAEQHRRELERLAELEKFQRLTVGRELKMVELKKEIAELRKEIEHQKKRTEKE